MHSTLCMSVDKVPSTLRSDAVTCLGVIPSSLAQQNGATRRQPGLAREKEKSPKFHLVQHQDKLQSKYLASLKCMQCDKEYWDPQKTRVVAPRNSETCTKPKHHPPWSPMGGRDVLKWVVAINNNDRPRLELSVLVSPFLLKPASSCYRKSKSTSTRL